MSRGKCNDKIFGRFRSLCLPYVLLDLLEISAKNRSAQSAPARALRPAFPRHHQECHPPLVQHANLRQPCQSRENTPPAIASRAERPRLTTNFLLFFSPFAPFFLFLLAQPLFQSATRPREHPALRSFGQGRRPRLLQPCPPGQPFKIKHIPPYWTALAIAPA